MTQQYTGRNNATISMPDGGSVPIVSQTEIDPMKTALSLMLALITTALTEPLPRAEAAGAGRELPAQVHRKRLILHAVVWRAGDDRQAAGTCPWGLLASGNYCLRSGR